MIEGFIVDFYCRKAALVIELDGDVYDLQQKEPPPSFGHLPQMPSSWNLGEARWGLNELRLRIVRFRNEEVLENLLLVVGKIKELVFT